MGVAEEAKEKDPPEEDSLILDVSGTCYELQKDIVERFPNALAYQLWEWRKNSQKSELPKGVYSSRSPNRFFVQRSPVLFTIILQCYTTGKLHVPRWMCKDNMADEIKFWELDTHFACECCAPSGDDEDDEEDEEVLITNETTEASEKAGQTTGDAKQATKWECNKRNVWRFFQNPKSSRGATVFAGVSICVVIVSTVFYILESIPELKVCTANEADTNGSTFVVVGGMFQDHSTNDSDATAAIADANSTDGAVVKRLRSNAFIQYFSNCLSWQVFKAIETLCVLWFTVELVARFLVCPNRLKFVTAPLNIIDVLASANIYLEIFLVLILKLNQHDMSVYFIKAIKILRTVTVLRILKFIRYFEDLRLLVKTFKSAKKELGMLCIFVIVTVLIYSCLLYEIEKDIPGTDYYSVPASAWWSIVTLTTVGFGDVVPMSTLGKIVGGCACVTGIIIIALPVSVLVEHFTAAYKKKLKSF